ncbi:hypothetical protein F2X28_004624 [Escherichia coli]|nr:hypothetical protein [Escherichia coli]EER6763591.1 hypothetical protein [Escherichia coli]EER7020649.1 hypothetical protein [Escherichia coli]EER7113727.1 hypothetical protein [Escherichia coli]
MLTFNERLEQIAIACEFQQHELDHRLTQARAQYNAKCKVVMVKADLARFLFEEERLVAQGYRLDKHQPPVMNGLGIIGFFLKPEKLIRKELAELEKTTEQNYRAELEDTRSRLMAALEADVDRARRQVERHKLELSALEELSQFTSDYDLIVDKLTEPKS